MVPQRGLPLPLSRLLCSITSQGRFLHQSGMAPVSCPALLLSIPTLPTLDLRVCHAIPLGLQWTLSTVRAVAGFERHGRDVGAEGSSGTRCPGPALQPDAFASKSFLTSSPVYLQTFFPSYEKILIRDHRFLQDLLMGVRQSRTTLEFSVEFYVHVRFCGEEHTQSSDSPKRSWSPVLNIHLGFGFKAKIFLAHFSSLSPLPPSAKVLGQRSPHPSWYCQEFKLSICLLKLVLIFL